MKTNIQFVHAERSPSAEQLIQKKLDKLETKFDDIISADIIFKEEKDTTAGKGKICAVELNLPGPRIHASSNEESFEAAAAETVNDIERQLRRRKTEMTKR